ncbi:MFS transporter [Bradyrhizobium betae]|nr:MFS transporter [Bradyrhizobium betae]
MAHDLESDPKNSAGGRVGALLVLTSALPIFQAVLITPILSIVRDADSQHAFATFALRCIVAAPAVSVLFLLPFFGRFADRFQRRHILIFGLTLYAVSGVFIYASPGLISMFAGRLLLGVAVACVMTATASLTGDLFRGNERNRILGLQYAASAAVGMLFPIIGGLIALADWHLVFLFYLIALPLILPATRLPDRIVAAPGEERSFRALALKPLLGSYALLAIGTMVLWLITIQLAFHLSGLGYTSPVTAGIALGTPCLSGILVAILYGRVKRHLSFRTIAAAAFLLMSVSYGAISVTTSLPLLIFALLLAGAGFGLNQPNCSAWLLSQVTTEFAGRAAAGLTFAVCVGQIAAPLIYQALITSIGSAACFAVVSFACLLVALAAFFKSRLAPHPDDKLAARSAAGIG